jgi:hypothetical protein
VRNLFSNGGHLLLRRAAVQAAGEFLPGLAYGEDWEFCYHKGSCYLSTAYGLETLTEETL